QEKKSLHIAYAVDKNYYKYTSVSILSIIENNTNIDFTFHIIYMNDLPEEDKIKMEDFRKQYSLDIKQYKILSNCLDKFYNFSKETHFNEAIYLRLFIAEKVQGITDSVLYIDTDVFCFNKIDEILKI